MAERGQGLALEVERDADVLVLTINRPHSANAVNDEVAAGIAAALDQLDADSELAVGILTGAGRRFSAGLDLKALAAGELVYDADLGLGSLAAAGGRGFGGIVRRPSKKPLVAAIEGFAVAGGLELALACDLIVAGESARFGISEIKRGLIAGSGALIHLPHRIPYHVAMEMALTGDLIGAAEARQWGLLNRVVPDGEALESARVLAHQVAAAAPLAAEGSKQVLRTSAEPSEHEVWMRQEAVAAPVFASEDAREGARAFAEGRPAVWRGR